MHYLQLYLHAYVDLLIIIAIALGMKGYSLIYMRSPPVSDHEKSEKRASA